MGIGRDEVEELAPAPWPGGARLLSEAMRPADTADRWTGFAPAAGALDGVALIVARNEQEEATAIALAAREAAEEAGPRGALGPPRPPLPRPLPAGLARRGLGPDLPAGARPQCEPAV